MAYDRLKCPKCDLDFGQELRLLAHLSAAHGVTDHLGCYLELHHGGDHPTCACSPGCTERVKWAGWKKGFTSRFVRGHNARALVPGPDAAPPAAELRPKAPRTQRPRPPRQIAAIHVCDVPRPSSPVSIDAGRQSVLDFVRSLGVEALSSDRTAIAPLELDVWVPSHRLGVEYNGLYWHSAACDPDKARSQRKLDACNAAGVHLYSIFEDEWRDHGPIIQSMLKHRLGLSSRRVYARALQLRQLSTDEAKAFFSAHHLEGYARSSVTFGLVDAAGQAVAALSLRRPFHKRYADMMEVSRCCSAAGLAVAGWLGRLTKEALAWTKQHGKQGMMTYVDSRVGMGDGYASAGWRMAKASTGPRFHWTDFHRRYNRFACKADKERGLTQRQAADEMGFIEIWGCSNSLWQIG
jgi:hypothetical protein